MARSLQNSYCHRHFWGILTIRSKKRGLLTMDANDQNQSIDGIKPADGAVPVYGVDGFSAAPQPAAPAPTPPSQPQVIGMPVLSQDVEKAKKPKKGVAGWLVVILVIIFAVASAAGVYFYQAQQSKKDLDAAKAQTAEVQKQLSTANTQNATLQETLDAQTAYVKTLTEVATQLKTTCGKACDAITIPSAPVTTEATN